MSRLPALSSRRAGFSLVDVMLGLALGLVTMVVIVQAYITFHGYRRSAGGIVEAQGVAMGALFAIERDAQQSGPGLGDARLLGCDARTAPAASITLAPVRIAAGPDGAPDTLLLLSGDSLAAPARLAGQLLAGDTGIGLASTHGMRPGDILGLQEAGKPCALVKVAAVDSVVRVTRSTLNDTPPSSVSDPLASGTSYSAAATAFNLGRLKQVSYSIVNGELRRAVSDHGGNSAAASALGDNIVSLKAQYGFDTRPAVGAALQATRWSATMLDADSSGVAGDSGDWQRIAGLRIALVARSAAREGGSNCRTTVDGTANAPAWQASDSSGALRQVPISLTHLKDWQCYRYRVYETVVPLRNVLWGRP